MILLNFIFALTPLQKANQLYRDGNFEKANAIYDSLAQLGIVNPYLYYNLGNSYYRLGKRGLALLYYEKAFYLDPADKDIKNNISLIAGENVSKNPISRFFKKVIYLLNLRGWLSIFILLYGLFSIFLSLFIWKRTLIHITLSIIFLLFSFIPLSSSLYWISRMHSGEAVVIETTEARSGPGENFQKLLEVNEATPCKILRKDNGWLLITLGKGTGGWVKKETVKRVIPF